MSNNAKTAVRVSSNSSKPLHHIKENCELIENIIKSLPEISDMKEPYNSQKYKTCRHNCLCYEVECGFAHTFTIEARKMIRKEFKKAEKVKKIKGEIQKLGEEGFEKSWGDY
uniref:Uncharacterized protein n=1 Tax=viral metagenome TaxID=1070528 RepID=A0A6C0EQW2_9ZZZZ